MKIYGSFYADSYQEVSIDWLTVTLKYDNHGVGKQYCSPRIMGQRCAMEACACSEHKLDLTRPDEITEKTQIRGIANSQIF